MKQIFKKIFGSLILSMLLVSCGPVTAVPTATAVPTRTALPTNTSIPEPSITATLSPVEDAFALPTRQTYFVDTPTPIATPEFGNSSIRLKDLSEQEFLTVIYEMNNYSYQNYPSLYGDWWTNGLFVRSQQPVALAIQEYLYRFPQSPYAYRLHWQLAFINSIGDETLPGNVYDDAWIVSELQAALNQGNVLADQLEQVLDRFWFDIAYAQPIENLFDDGKTSMMYVIVPQVWEEEETDPKTQGYFQHGALFIAVREIQPHNFQVFLLKSAWNFSFSESFLYAVSDHNQNGVPEIALYIGSHSGTMCEGYLLIYEWDADAFVELTKSNVYLRDCTEDFEYLTVDNVPAILYHGILPSRTETYIWDGEYYEFAGNKSTSAMDMWWATTGIFPEEAEALGTLLLSGGTEGLSASETDFLRFRLGIVTALNFDHAQAKQILQEVVDHPVDETRTVYSDLARNFLQYYVDDQSLLLACRKSRELFDVVANSSENEEDLFGIRFDFVFKHGLLRCRDQDVFELLIARMPAVVENVPAQLSKFGVNLSFAEKQDVNLDGVTNEWLVLFNNDIYVAFPSGEHYEAINLASFWYDEEFIKSSDVQIKIERWMGLDDPIMVVRTDSDLTILRIGDEYHATELNFDFDVKDVVFVVQDVPPEYQVFSLKPKPGETYYGTPWSGYRWDFEYQDFRADLLEYTLFIERNPMKAFEIAEVVTPFLMDWRDEDAVDYWLPRYFYLCGLADELSGNTQKAAEMYWQIWHNFPESHYALMARYKLEVINP